MQHRSLFPVIVLSLFFFGTSLSFGLPPEQTMECAGVLERQSISLFFSDTEHKATPVEEGRVFLLEDDPKFETSLLVGDPAVFETSDSVMVMLPGMGGAVRKYGIAASAGQFARTMLSMNIYPVGLQNWVYYGGAENRPVTDDERVALAERYSSVGEQMEALTEFLGRLVARAHKAGKKVSILTRSNGTGLILQWLSEAAKKGGRAYEIARKLSAVFVAGLNSPLPHHRPIWIAAEEAMEANDPGSLDPHAKQTDRALYAKLTYADAEANAAIHTERTLPPVVAFIAGQDQFVPVEMQEEVMEALHRGHPELPLILYYTDLEHDPLRGLNYFYLDSQGERKRGKARSGERFKRAYADILGNPPSIVCRRGEMLKIELPEFRNSQRRVEAPPKDKK